jgi:hypothetical protein
MEETYDTESYGAFDEDIHREQALHYDNISVKPASPLTPAGGRFFPSPLGQASANSRY